MKELLRNTMDSFSFRLVATCTVAVTTACAATTTVATATESRAAYPVILTARLTY